MVIDFIKGKNIFNRKYYRFVDVRDVVLVYIKVFEIFLVNGRYIIDVLIVIMEEIEKILCEFFFDLCIVYE